MRFLVAFLVIAATASGEAAASSFVVLEAPKAGAASSILSLGAPSPDSKAPSPSIIALGSPAPSQTLVASALPAPSPTRTAAPADGPTTPSQSIIAFGEPPVTLEKVAAIPNETKSKRVQDLSPMVIRGGLVGDAFERAIEPQQVSEPEAAAAAAPPADRPRRRAPPKPPAGTVLPAPEPAVDAPGPIER